MPENKTKIIFMGTGSFAGTILSALLEEKYDIAAVFTKAEKNIHQNSAPEENQVREIAQTQKMLLIQPEKLDSEITAQIKDLCPELIVIVSYGKIIPQEIIDLPKFGCINVHPSLLPKFRGPSPIQNALLNGEKETGTTIMLINEKMDAGDILAQRNLAVDPNDTYETLSKKLADLSTRLLLETLPAWMEGKITPHSQDHSQATLCQLIERQDGQIVWEEEAEKIYDRYRALHPWPGIFSFWKRGGKTLRLKLQKISLAKNNLPENNLPGKVFELEGKISIGTLKGAIILEEVQLEGKKTTPIQDFVNGYPDFKNSTLE